MSSISAITCRSPFEKAGWLADLSGYLKDSNLTAPDLAESDFRPPVFNTQERQGQMLSLPCGRLLHPLLQQGVVPEEGRRGAENLR